MLKGGNHRRMNRSHRCLARMRLQFEGSSIHGFRYLAERRITFMERIFWLVIVMLALYLLISMTLQSWHRYRTRSTVIGLDRNYCNWNTTLPSTTICPLKRLNRDLFNKYISAQSHPFEERDMNDLFEFLESLANTTFTNIKDLQIVDNIDQLLDYFGIKSMNYLELIYNLTLDRSLRYVDDIENHAMVRVRSGLQVLNSRLVLTEFGLCYLFNTKLAPEFSASFMLRGEVLDSDLDSSELYIETRSSSYFAGGVSYNILGLEIGTPFNMYIHSPYDVMTREKDLGYMSGSFKYVAETHEIISDDDLEGEISIGRRQCRFQRENNLLHFPIYTNNLCISECRLNLIQETCGCIPHFYPNNGAFKNPICDYKELQNCVNKNKDQFYNLYTESDQAGRTKYSCSCLQNCEDSLTAVSSMEALDLDNMNVFTGGHSIQVFFEKMPNFRYKRSIIYTTTDWLISLGSTASLFMGICVLNLLETVYDFTLRTLFSCMCDNKK